jgi:hypothetical protein
MTTKTLQGWFNGAVKRAETKTKSINEAGACAYFPEQGPGCFIGCQVSPGEDIQEGNPARYLVMKKIISVTDRNEEDSQHLLDELQNIHDSKIPQEWDIYLKEYAEEHDLEYSP